MASTAALVLLLLLLALHSTIPAYGARVGYQYTQSTVGGQASIFLNLWGTLGGCGAGTSNELHVELMSGTIMGPSVITGTGAQSVAYPGVVVTESSGSPFTFVAPSNCVNISGLSLGSGGLGLLAVVGSSGVVGLPPVVWLLSYNAASPPLSPVDYYELTRGQVSGLQVQFDVGERLSPPVLIPLTGPSVGLLFNGGFEQTATANSINSTRDIAAGWTGGYTVEQYSDSGNVSAPLPGQSTTSQRQYVSLSGSLSQGSLPLTIGLPYELSWYASCEAAGGGACSYSVTTTSPQQTVTYSQTGSSWQQRSRAVALSPLDTGRLSLSPSTMLTFTPLSGNPLIDSILLTYATTDSQVNTGLPAFPDGWEYAFDSGSSLLTDSSYVLLDDLVVNNTEEANVTDYSTVLAGGVVESGGLVHTYPDHVMIARPTDDFFLDFVAQGGRAYTLSLRATAFIAANNGLIALWLSFRYHTSRQGSTGGAVSYPLLPPPCTLGGGTPAACSGASIPHTQSTRRRLLQVNTSPDTTNDTSGVVYYTCSAPGFPCNNSLLTLTVSPPNELMAFDGQLQIIVYNMDVALTNIQLTSDGPLYSLAISTQPDPSGAIGDPQFTGLLGQRYQVHGVSGTVYNIITDAMLQVNARFDFLASGAGPHADVIVTQPWTHPGTYMGAMSFQVRSGANTSHVDVVVVEAGGSSEGFARVSINGQQVTHPYTWQSDSETGEGEHGEVSDSDSVSDRVSDSASASEHPPLTVRFVHSHVLELDTAQFRFRLTSSDRFINHEAAPTVPLHALSCHGLLGQTRVHRQYPTAVRYIEGSVDDYAVGTQDDEKALLGGNFAFNQFDSHVSSGGRL